MFILGAALALSGLLALQSLWTAVWLVREIGGSQIHGELAALSGNSKPSEMWWCSGADFQCTSGSEGHRTQMIGF